MVALIVFRAGLVEELFYRGFAIDRLARLSGSTGFASLVSLILFAAAHYRQGLGTVVAAAMLGALLTMSYLKWRDLVASIVAHCFVDFVLNLGKIYPGPETQRSALNGPPGGTP